MVPATPRAGGDASGALTGAIASQAMGCDRQQDCNSDQRHLGYPRKRRAQTQDCQDDNADAERHACAHSFEQGDWLRTGLLRQPFGRIETVTFEHQLAHQIPVDGTTGIEVDPTVLADVRRDRET
jgi:hypothetical protein